MKLSFKFLPLLAFAVFAGFSASALEAKFVSIEGKVEILEGGMWIPVEEGDIIQERGVVISTGFKSNAVVSVKGTNFTLGPLTRITIENMVAMENKDSTQIYIDSGSLKANVSSSDGRKVGFKVRSAVATASVRGTEFKVTSSGRLSVTQGLVSFGVLKLLLRKSLNPRIILPTLLHLKKAMQEQLLLQMKLLTETLLPKNIQNQLRLVPARKLEKKMEFLFLQVRTASLMLQQTDLQILMRKKLRLFLEKGLTMNLWE